MKLDKFYINGEWISPVKDEKIDIINPSDESVIGTLNVGSRGLGDVYKRQVQKVT